MTFGHKRSLSAVYDYLKEEGADVEELKSNIEQVIVKTLISGLPHLKFMYRSCQPDNHRSDMCFEILGFDILLHENLQPSLL